MLDTEIPDIQRKKVHSKVFAYGNYLANHRCGPHSRLEDSWNAEYCEWLLLSLFIASLTSQVLKKILEMDISDMSSGTAKLILAACVSSKSLYLIRTYLKLFKESNFLSHELLYMGIATACKQYAWRQAYDMYLIGQKESMKFDTYLINNLVITLTQCKRFHEACDILEQCHNHGFGTDVKGAVSTYSVLLDAAGRDQNANVVKRMMAMMNLDTRLTPEVEALEMTLNLYTFSNDFPSSLEVFNLWDRLYGCTVRAYELLLCCFVYSTSDKIWTAEMMLEMESIVGSAIASSIDASSSHLSNLILKYFATCKQVERAALYMGRMRCLGWIPTASSVLCCSQAVCGKNHGRSEEEVENKRLRGLRLAQRFFHQGLLPPSPLNENLATSTSQFGVDPDLR